MTDSTEDSFRQISFRLTEKERNRFLALVKGAGRDTTEVLRAYARTCIDRNEIVEDSTPDRGERATLSEIIDTIERAKAGLREIEDALACWKLVQHLTDDERDILIRAASDPYQVEFLRRMQSAEVQKSGRAAERSRAVG